MGWRRWSTRYEWSLPMVELYSYEVLHWTKSSGFASNTDISDDVIGVPIFTDAGTGTFNSAVILLDMEFGNKLTSGVIIEDLDRITLKYEYLPDTSEFFYGIYDVIKRSPKFDDDVGYRLELTLIGIERHLDKINYSIKGFFKSAFDMGEKMLDQYDESKGTLNPFILTTDVTSGLSTNTLPNWTSNIYDYGIGPDKIYSRLLELTDKQGGSVEDGAVLDYYTIKPTYTVNSPTTMSIDLFSQGNPDVTVGNEVLIEDTIDLVVSDIKGGLDSEEANVINTFGHDTSGSMPRDYAVFKSAQEKWDFTPEWVEDALYKVGARVQTGGTHYKCDTEHTSTVGNKPPGVNWTSITEATEFGDVFQYSPYTDDKATSIWINSNGNPNDTLGTFGKRAQIDSNIVVWDEITFRVPVEQRINNPALMSLFLKYYEHSDGDYTGLRCLVDAAIGVPAGDFAGNDSNGVSFAQSVAEYNFERKEWFVKYPATEGMLVGVNNEADVYAYRSGVWVNVATEASGPFSAGKNDCYHVPTSVTNVPGIITGFATQSNSAVAAQYDWNPVAANTIERNTVEYYKQGAWLTLRFPLPTTSWNAITEDIGDIYGGGTHSVTVGGADDVRMPAFLDIQNNEWTPLGFKGWNQGEQTENLSQITSIDNFMKMKDEGSSDGGTTYDPIGLSSNFKIRCAVLDLNDNVAILDKVIDFNNEWQPMSFPVAGFSVIRNRRPKDFVDLVIPPKKLNTVNNFEWRHVKQITWQTQESYDDKGRYDPLFGRYGQIAVKIADFDFFGIAIPIPGPADERRLTMYMDALRFTKPLVANTGIVSDYVIESDPEERPDISNYFQLVGDGISTLQKKKHKHVEYTITTSARFDIKHGDFFFFKDTSAVPFSDMAATPGTVLLVATHIEYSMTEDGLVRTIVGIRRFT